jgi:hypothetical protein
VVTVELTSNAVCLTGNPAISDALTMVVNPTLPVSVSIEADANPVCEGTTVTYTATPVNGGTTPSYQWKVNDVNYGTDSNIFTCTPADGAVVTVELTSNALCLTGNPASSEVIYMEVNIAPAITTEPEDQTAIVGNSVSFSVVATGEGLSYQWRKGTTDLSNGGSISGAVSAMLTIDPVILEDAATDYNVVVSGSCLPNASSVDVTLGVTTVGIDPNNSNGVFSISPNPFSKSINITISDVTKIGNYEMRIYNLLGLEMINTTITNESTIVETSNLPSGLYLYFLIDNEKIIQSGKMISEQK